MDEATLGVDTGKTKLQLHLIRADGRKRKKGVDNIATPPTVMPISRTGWPSTPTRPCASFSRRPAVTGWISP